MTMTPEQRRDWRARRIGAGGCLDCSAMAAPGHRFCARHLEDRKRGARRRNRSRRLALNHPCARCNEPAFKSDLCRRCAISLTWNAKRARLGLWHESMSVLEVDAALEIIGGERW